MAHRATKKRKRNAICSAAKGKALIVSLAFVAPAAEKIRAAKMKKGSLFAALFRTAKISADRFVSEC
jgi:hypothetical protein